MIYLIPYLAFIFYSDWKSHKIPNWVLLIASLTAIAIAVIQHDLGIALLGGLFAVLAMSFIKVAGYPIGMGDIKLAGLIGLMTGENSWIAVVGAWVLSAVIVAFIQRRKNIKGEMFPFGCSLCVAGALTLIIA